jgi:hypothetical protein
LAFEGAADGSGGRLDFFYRLLNILILLLLSPKVFSSRLQKVVIELRQGTRFQVLRRFLDDLSE